MGSFPSGVDLIIDEEVQVLETGTGVETIVLIAALFNAGRLVRYISLAVEVCLTSLVEIHDE
jgi:indole-3-glycerol phosphate synthase